MNDRIKLLPESVANQIAAGEVVNRPASVVKEMVENSVDAGAVNITVNFRDGGKSLIQIVDDGCGMSENDARLAFDRHATSKITRVDDIYTLSTFGFRGEALASIASVAEVELRTRPCEREFGTEVRVAGGKFISQESVNCPAGTTISVRNLFYNVPARRRFLEKSASESRHITSEFHRVAICHPQIGFTLCENDQPMLKLLPSGLRQRIAGIFGRNISKNLLDVTTDTSIVKVSGFCSRPSAARQNNRQQYLFVNGRFFKSPYFHKAVVSAYEKLIPQNCQPSYFIFLEIDTERIDVNVHPQKTEVKFEDGQQIWQIIHAAVRESLAKSGLVPAMDFDMSTDFEIPVARTDHPLRVPQIKANPEFNPFREGYTERTVASYESFINGPEEDFAAIADVSELEYVNEPSPSQAALFTAAGDGQTDIIPAGTKYAVAARDGSLTLIDIRRAWESILFERYLVMLTSGNSMSQQLLFPETCAMSFDDWTLARDFEQEFRNFGFDLGFEAELCITVRGVPAEITDRKPEALLYELLDVLRDEGVSGQDVYRGKMAAALARAGSMAKSGTLRHEDLQHLVEELHQCGNPSYTPSGLPVAITLDQNDIADLFKRTE